MTGRRCQKHILRCCIMCISQESSLTLDRDVGLPGGASGEETGDAGDIRDEGSIPGSGRSPGGGHHNPLQYSCLENPMDREV